MGARRERAPEIPRGEKGQTHVGFRIFNTFTRQKEDFQPADPEGRRVGFYNCGPTVYGPFHIGNARNFVVADTLRRWLQRLGYEVRFVQNITDVDDKIIARAQKEGRSPEDVAREFTALFFEHAGRLGVRPADAHPKATEYIGPMIAMVERLIAGGHAYATPDGSVWFRTASYARYGELSKKPMDELREGERVDAEQQRLIGKSGGFLPLEGSKPGEPAWPSPWGLGRPGWHTECAVMSRDLLGDTLDIHNGRCGPRFPAPRKRTRAERMRDGQTFCATGRITGFLISATRRPRKTRKCRNRSATSF
jgi:cysteinyl-tRNA synthetase